jgi:hypothetical protein
MISLDGEKRYWKDVLKVKSKAFPNGVNMAYKRKRNKNESKIFGLHNSKSFIEMGQRAGDFSSRFSKGKNKKREDPN